MTTGAIYARVSTPGQREEGTSLETQVRECISFAEHKGLDIPPHLIFQEQASGADSNRPRLAHIRLLAREGRINTLVVYHPDRLSRDATDLMVIFEEISEAGVEVLFVHGPSGNSPEDKLLRFIFGYKSEAERRDTIERTMRGKRQTARNGKMPNGTGRGLYGYRLKWVVDEQTAKPKQAGREIVEDEAEVVRQIFDMAIARDSAHKIAVALNQQGIPSKTGSKWHPWTIKNLLKNAGYMGITYYGKERVHKPKNSSKRVRTPKDPSEWIEVEGYTPPLVSEEVFTLVQQRLLESTSRPGKAIEPYLLSGHVVCGYCGTPMAGSTLNRRYRYYRCRGTWATATTPRYCNASYMPTHKLEVMVWSKIEEAVEHPEAWMADMQQIREMEQAPIDDEISRIEQEIRRCKNRELRLVKLYQWDEVDDEWIRAESGPIKLMRKRHETELEGLKTQKVNVEEMARAEDHIKLFCERVRHNLDSFDFDDKRFALRALQIKAIVTTDTVRVKGIIGLSKDPTGAERDLATTARTSG